jgi:hypothetical protein
MEYHLSTKRNEVLMKQAKNRGGMFKIRSLNCADYGGLLFWVVGGLNSGLFPGYSPTSNVKFFFSLPNASKSLRVIPPSVIPQIETGILITP